MEVSRLWSASFRDGGDLSAADRSYIAHLIAARTGLSEADAEKRVDDTITEAKAAADKARSGAAKLSLWLTAAMLFGAFAASLAAAEGGSLRDGTWNERGVLIPRRTVKEHIMGRGIRLSCLAFRVRSVILPAALHALTNAQPKLAPFKRSFSATAAVTARTHLGGL